MHFGRTEEMDRARHVEERLVDRDALHERREITEHGHDLIGDALVVGEVAVDEQQLGAELLGPPAGHAALHPEPLRLVGRRQDHTAADGDRSAPQRRVEQLLDRGVERVEIGMQDRRRGEHRRPR